MFFIQQKIQEKEQAKTEIYAALEKEDKAAFEKAFLKIKSIF